MSCWFEKSEFLTPVVFPTICFTTQPCAMGNALDIRHADFRILGTTLNQRRFTYNKDLVWILNHLGQHGKILSLTLGFCGRRNVKMILRDGDFLNALKGVKTDKLLFGDPEYEGSSRYHVRFPTPCSLCPSRLSSFWTISFGQG